MGLTAKASRTLKRRKTWCGPGQESDEWRQQHTDKGSVEHRLLDRIPVRRITAPQPIQPHRNGLPHGNALSVAFVRKSSDPFCNMDRCACAIALFDSERASPQVLLVSH